jgi:hypothetical protein
MADFDEDEEHPLANIEALPLVGLRRLVKKRRSVKEAWYKIPDPGMCQNGNPGLVRSIAPPKRITQRRIACLSP